MSQPRSPSCSTSFDASPPRGSSALALPACGPPCGSAPGSSCASCRRVAAPSACRTRWRAIPWSWRKPVGSCATPTPRSTRCLPRELVLDGEAEDGEAVTFSWLTSRRELLARRPPLPVGAICVESGPVAMSPDGELEADDLTSLGTFTLRGGQLEFFGLSEARLTRATALIERRLGSLADRPRSRVRSVDAAVTGTATEGTPAHEASPAPMSGRRGSQPSLDARVRRLSYKRWIDDPHERLAGLSPREAAGPPRASRATRAPAAQPRASRRAGARRRPPRARGRLAPRGARIGWSTRGRVSCSDAQRRSSHGRSDVFATAIEPWSWRGLTSGSTARASARSAGPVLRLARGARVGRRAAVDASRPRTGGVRGAPRRGPRPRPRVGRAA